MKAIEDFIWDHDSYLNDDGGGYYYDDDNDDNAKVWMYRHHCQAEYPWDPNSLEV